MASPILRAMTESYEALYGRKPAVTAIHAGLECGIIGNKYPKLDMISFGRRSAPHSPDEGRNRIGQEVHRDFLVHTLHQRPVRK